MTDQKTPRRDDVPQGARFSRVYLDRGEPTPDSKRMRRRLAGLVDEFPELRSLSPVVARELGIDVPWGPRGPNPNWAKFLEQCDLRDVLDFVTVAFRHLEGIGVVYDTDTHRPKRNGEKVAAQRTLGVGFRRYDVSLRKRMFTTSLMIAEACIFIMTKSLHVTARPLSLPFRAIVM
jgi:hypothetical protein